MFDLVNAALDVGWPAAFLQRPAVKAEPSVAHLLGYAVEGQRNPRRWVAKEVRARLHQLEVHLHPDRNRSDDKTSAAAERWFVTALDPLRKQLADLLRLPAGSRSGLLRMQASTLPPVLPPPPPPPDRGALLRRSEPVSPAAIAQCARGLLATGPGSAANQALAMLETSARDALAGLSCVICRREALCDVHSQAAALVRTRGAPPPLAPWSWQRPQRMHTQCVPLGAEELGARDALLTDPHAPFDHFRLTALVSARADGRLDAHAFERSWDESQASDDREYCQSRLRSLGSLPSCAAAAAPAPATTTTNGPALANGRGRKRGRSSCAAPARGAAKRARQQ